MRFAAFLVFATSLALAAPAGAGPLHQAPRKGSSVVIADPLASGAYVNVQDALGNTPLHRAAKFGHAAAIGTLLAAGADPKIRNKQGVAYRDLALEAGEEATAAALRRAVSFSSTIRSGIYANPTCPDPDHIWIHVPHVTIRIDRASDGDLVSMGHTKSESDPLVGGWQRFEIKYADGETFGYFLRMETSGSVRMAWWNPGPRNVQEPPPDSWPDMLAAIDADARWELVDFARCDAIPFPLSLLHGEPVAFLFSLEPAIVSCRRGSPECVQHAFAAVDVHQDGALSTAEWARIIRIALYFALAFDESIKSDRLGAAYAVSVLTAPLAASAIVSSYDYDGDGKTSLEELHRAFVGQGDPPIPEIGGLDPDLRARLGQAMTILRNLSRQLPDMK